MHKCSDVEVCPPHTGNSLQPDHEYLNATLPDGMQRQAPLRPHSGPWIFKGEPRVRSRLPRLRARYHFGTDELKMSRAMLKRLTFGSMPNLCT